MNRFALSFCLVATVACTSSGAKDQVSVSGQLPGSSSAADGGTTPADGGVQVASGIDLSRARIAVSRLRVEERSDAGHDGEVDLAAGPFLIDASGDKLAGALQTLITTNVPAGTYTGFKVNVHRVDPPAPAAFDALTSQHASIILDGTIDGNAFTFVSGLEAELEHEVQFTVGQGATNITIALEPSRWFVGVNGQRLDPRDPAARAAIEANIRASFRAFRDDDEDGVDDDHGHDAADAGDDHGHDAADAGDDHGHDAADAGDDHGHDGADAGDDHGHDRDGGDDHGHDGGGGDDGSGHH
ncbi:MAG TPA: hypothetical protein VFE90_16350 [Myxococcales bacterium]|nr:hypothetical protein [Myxococcales bacterium]